MVKDHQMRRLFIVSMWMQYNHKRETRWSKVEKENVMKEAEVGVIHFEVGGRAMNQGMQAASRNLKRHGNALCLRASRKNAALPTP